MNDTYKDNEDSTKDATKSYSLCVNQIRYNNYD